MFAAGEIIYFNPFYFKNGNTAKNKYFIVLRNLDNTTILASLPTRTNRIPSFITQNHGCINHDEHCFNCYLFESGRIICDNGFHFDVQTFIYGNEVEDYDVNILKGVYAIEGIDYDILGKLHNQEYTELLNCIQKSNSVKRRIKRLLAL